MFSTSDTIVAIATPAGRGGIGVVRVSGPSAEPIARRLTRRPRPFIPRHATLATFAAESGLTDRVVVTSFPAPASYTGEDVVEISAHGSPVVLNAIVGEAMSAGARLAEPGEFTLRAFLNQRLDLPQAEAVADLIDAVTPVQARAAFDQLNGTLSSAIAEMETSLFDLIARLEASVDFPDEGYHFIEPEEIDKAIALVCTRAEALLHSARRGRVLREGRQIAIAGPPNAGKSSLFNALVGSDRAIVTDIPGTTRDMVTESIDLAGVAVTLVDTAGVRDTDDLIEAEGVRRSRVACEVADVVWWLADLSAHARLDEYDAIKETGSRVLLVGTKSDLPARWNHEAVVKVSSLTGSGLDELRHATLTLLDVEGSSDTPAITNIRHVALLERAHEALVRARVGLQAQGTQMAEELVLADLGAARDALEEITGRRTSDDLLGHIFSRFCIGK